MTIVRSLAGLALVSFSQGLIAQETEVKSVRTAPAVLKIAALSMPDALAEFAQQTGLQMVVASEAASGLRAPAISGTYTPDAALTELLTASGLQYRFINERTVAIGREAAQMDVTRKDERALVLAAAPGSNESPSSRRSEATLPPHIRLARRGEGEGEDVRSTAGLHDMGLEEVVVTAQKRTESAVNVPISITAFGPEELEALRVQGIEDFVFNIPNATYYSTGRSAPRVSLRGVSSVTGGQFDPIAITVDDASFGATSMRTILGSRAFDAERMEILRGPQGTLTGASSLGGTINIITAKPDPTAFALSGTLDVSRFSTVLAKAVLNTPITDTLAIRTLAFIDRSDGAVKNIGPAGGDSGHDNLGGRVATRWMPSDALTVDASVSYEEQRFGYDSSLYIDRYAAGEREGAIAQLEALGGVFDDGRIDFIERAGNNGGRVSYDNPDFTDIDNLVASVRASYNVGRHTLDLIYGHFANDLRLSLDVDDSEFAIQRNYWTWYDDADSVELRVSSSYDGPLNWVAGVSYQEEEFKETGGFDSGDGGYAGAYELAGLWVTFLGLESRAAFANVFWDIGQRLHLSAGARLSEVKTAYASLCCGDPVGSGIVLPQLEPAVLRSRSTEFTPRVALNVDLFENTSAYVQFATGYRPGYGNDARAVGLQQTEFGLFDVPTSVDAENVKNYEIGLKGYFFDRQLSLATAVFHMDYSDLQVTAGVTATEFVSFDVNAGEASTQGFEIETAWRALDALELRANVGYVDAKIDELQLFGGTTVKDIDMPQVRPWTVNLSGIYERALPMGLRAQFRTDYTWHAQAFTAPDKAPDEELPAFNKVDLSIGLVAERWSMTAYMENVFDETYWVGTQGGYALRGHKAPFVPRTFGLRFTMNHGH